MNRDFQGDQPLRCAVALFHPDSLAIELALTRQEVVAVNAGNALSGALAQSSPDERRRAVFAHVPREPKRFTAMVAHEHDHLRRHLGTSHGLALHVLRSRLPKLFAEVFDCDWKGPQSIPFPLLTPRRIEALVAQPTSASSGREPGLALLEVLGTLTALDGAQGPEAFGVTWRYLEGWAKASGVLLSEPVLPQAAPAPPSSAPTYSWNGRWLGVTARHLYEFLGMVQQGNTLLSMGEELEMVEELLREQSGDYGFVVGLWNHRFPLRDLPDPFDQPRDADELFLDYARLFPLELWAAVDLALWLPISPQGLTSMSGQLRWADLQPGARFLEVLEVYRELELAPTPIPATSREKNEALSSLQRQVCLRRGWRFPEDLAREWLAWLEDPSTDPNTPWLDAENSGRRETAAQLLRVRLERPGELVLGDLDSQAEGISRSPAWVLKENDAGSVLGVVPMGDERDDDTLQPSDLQGCFRAMRYLATGEAGHEDVLAYTTEVRRRAVECLSRLYAKCGGKHAKVFQAAATVALES